MVDAVSAVLPFPVPINHLGMYRDRALQPVEYYNNLSDHHGGEPAELAIILDPVIATGVTCLGAIESLREYGAKKILIIGVLCSEPGIRKVAACGADVEIWIGGCDPGTDAKGMIRPGMGDVGDRLFLTLGK
jgi:uracil phosphoribosyltransferase